METVTVSDSREITLPPSIANSLGFEPGVLLKVEVDGGRIALVPVAKPPRVDGQVPQPNNDPPYNKTSDPLMALFGTIKTDVTDVAERHDAYIGQALLDELRGADRG